MNLCGNCRFFSQPALHSTAYGTCVRFPKTEDKHCGETCGEHKPVELVKIKETKSTTR
jgi:hypothetical protein